MLPERSRPASAPPGPLAGVAVIEIADGVAGAFCSRTLADLGADTIKVEPPQGDPLRSHGPFPGDAPDSEASGLFRFLNANKRSVTIDAATATGAALIDRLLEDADVLVAEGRVRRALDLDALRARRPGLIAASITPFGETGPYRDYAAYDINISAAGGLSFGTGFPDREPLTIPLQQNAYLGGFAAALAIVMALQARDRDGEGQLVDAAVAEAPALLLNGYHLPTYIYKGIPGRRWGNRMSLGLFPNCVLPALDGHICIDAPQLAQYRRFLEVLGDQPWYSEPRFRNRRAMSEEYPEEAEALIAPWFAERTKEEIFETTRARRVPCVPVKTIGEAIADPHLAERGFWKTVDAEGGDGALYPGPPYRFSESPWRLDRPAPRLGEHNGEVLRDRLGLALAGLRRAGVV